MWQGPGKTKRGIMNSIQLKAEQYIASLPELWRNDSVTVIRMYNAFIDGYEKRVIEEGGGKINYQKVYNTVIDTVCSFEGYSAEEIKSSSNSRKREIVMIRQQCIYFGKRLTKLSLQKLADPFGKDHATSLHSIRTIQNLIDTQKPFAKQMDEIEKLIDKKL